jgi:molybdopterin-guanine dinucleotide biosynthesis protein A
MAGPFPQSPQCSALLMAGGESRRMGRDKATMMIGGEPLWRRQVRTLREAGVAEIMIARGERELLGAGEPGLIALADAAPGCGPLGGLVAGVRQAKTDWTLVLAVDLPFMSAAFLRQMMAMAEQERLGLAPVLDGRVEPLAAVYPKGCLAFAEECLASRQLSMRALVERCVAAGLMRSFEVREHERAYFRNVNTPEDLPQGS